MGRRTVLYLVWAACCPASTDAQTDSLPSPSQSLPAERVEWVEQARATGFAIAQHGGDDFSDLRFLHDVLGDRRIVQLGESGHGFAEYSAVKARLVKFLHQEMGFTTIALETSRFECADVMTRLGSLTADEAMRGCVVGTLRSPALRELFAYVIETQATDRPLRVAGFDIQTSTATANRRPSFWRDLNGPVSAPYADSVARLDSMFLDVRFDRERLPARSADLVEAYRGVEAFLDAHPPDPSSAWAWEEGRALAESTRAYIAQLVAIHSGQDFIEIRDEAMARNVQALSANSPKLIVWGHNFHVRYANQDVDLNPVRTMGHWLAQTHRDQMYTVGLYARWGRGVMPDGRIFNVVPPESGSLESILGHVGEPVFFVDLPRTARGPDGVWARTPIQTKTWGQADVTLNLTDQYDGILFVDRVSPPGA